LNLFTKAVVVCSRNRPICFFETDTDIFKFFFQRYLASCRYSISHQ